MNKVLFGALREKLEAHTHLQSTLAILQWDQEIHVPEKGGAARAKLLSYLSVLAHDQLLALDAKKELSTLLREAKKNPEQPESIVVLDTWRHYAREKKLPSAFVQELAELGSQGHTTWTKARAQSDFSLFLPTLKRLIALKQKEAEYVGYKDSPYDALLDVYEPGLTTAQISPVFAELRDFLTRFLRTLKKSPTTFPNERVLHGSFPIAEQQAFNQWLAEKMGFDFAAGRLDQSTHPFTTSFHPHDVRITTRYREHDLLYSVGSTIHEAGHGLYEQGLPVEHFGTPLSESISLGIHESQSRLWENTIGKSRAFWSYVYPKLQKRFPKPFANVPLEDVYHLINRVEPSLIRTEADEVTYNLHIILRFEIERGLIEGTMKAKDLPEIWKAKMKEYLGVKVPNDREGVLQDVHWSDGSFGYFPTYALGNLYAAQFAHTAKQKIPAFEAQLKKGNFAPLREWLRKNIHAHGKTYSSAALVKEVTGEPLHAQYFIRYLEEKYGEIYNLPRT